ncbi:arabinogalactan endo-1,4-beta-galactosidase (plasmid) [Roseomonas sp. OT10]|uniref:arabinogalactan endo-1,4-beta-galactosidase n=1 Tax=Roseomonas cutis TaxID=2897332 RepID=UPI001E5C0F48|nr:arabinogalactan endo-1,4-beta-galactosidase [Roseomonas sp. OT10]UFN51659.1 arabinogalactan endo-1,4-beta-galactosidase [Roseomonas sp. OT10]
MHLTSMIPVLAGFECGRLGWNGHDLLLTTRHVPGDRMATHYRLALDHGLLRARDGLPWRHDVARRLQVADALGADVIWDLNHFDPPEDPIRHARAVALAARPDRPLWICPVNEPSIYPMLVGMSQNDAVRLAVTLVQVAKDHHADVRVLTADPLNGVGERQFEATDALVAQGFVDMVGVNYYPHTARTSLSKVLVKTARRYRLPILVAETSWHDGHREQGRRHPGWNKGDWLRHVRMESEAAVAKGADVVGLCWYPVVDSPPWNHPGSRRRWSHGLVRADLSVDPHLAAALAEHRQPTGQLSLDYAVGG